MSPTSYQAAPPRFMTIADARGCVKLPDSRGNAIAHAFIPKAEAAGGEATLRMLKACVQIALIMPMDGSSGRVSTQAAVRRHSGTAREDCTKGRKDFCHSEACRAPSSL